MNEIKCGFAQNLITPNLTYPTFLDGFGTRITNADSIFSDLYVKSCSFNFGDENFAIVQFDLIGFSDEIYSMILGQITALTGISDNNIALSCIHTHSAPTCGILKFLPTNYDYIYQVGQIASQTVKQSIDNAVSGNFDCKICEDEFQATFNRRGRLFCDKRIKCATFVDCNGIVKGTLCSASAHPTINRTNAVSADYLSVLNTHSTNDSPIIFLQGYCGDVKTLCQSEQTLDEKINFIGTQLYDAIQKSVSQAKFSERLFSDVTIIKEKVEIPMLAYPERNELEVKVKDIEQDYLSLPIDSVEKHMKLHELIWYKDALSKAGSASSITVPMQIFSLGRKLAFAFVPFETLTNTGLRIEKIFTDIGFESDRVFVLGYCNSVNGYLPPPEEFRFDGYEVKGSNEWYNLPACSPTSEPSVINWYKEKAKTI